MSMSNGGKNPWGTGPTGGGSRGDHEPDLDEALRAAQENLKKMSGMFGGGKFLPLILLVLVGLWLASGFFRVLPGENVVIQRFGEWSRTKQVEGLGYRLPWPIESHTTLNVMEVRRLEIGFVEGPTYRASSGQKRDIPEESLMLTSDANIVDLDLIVFWNIKVAEDYLFNVSGQQENIKKVAESAIREVVGQTPLQSIITEGRDVVAERARSIMQSLLDEYKAGVMITQVLIQDATVHPDVLQAFEDVVAATQDAERFQNEATIYRNDIIPKARGEAIQMLQSAEAYRDSQIAKAEGDAQRFNAVYEAYLAGKDVTKERIFLETMESILKDSTKIIIDQEQGQGVLPYLPLNEMNKNRNR